ncbi:hypothetical protein GZH47_12795 [Paenibacillus rhizovicinus]|uniref:Yip1 domain-containing protein n=1 Tax=Paenibacillus rhizovicinus TaxID=2704463 RepID=A0A6C0NZU2_9BACL|nr:hypothetical protein [Paenibacillus rhizovicinus]QHW31631.1 hypothetical protein GZH47_12795 [Paenibacillus rhizovicinus]
MPNPTPSLLSAIPALFARKMTTAAIASTVIVLSLALTNIWGITFDSWRELLGQICFLLLYVVPIIYIYGVAASMLIEFLLFKLSPYPWTHRLLSLPLHAFFGFLGLWLLFPSMQIGGWGAAFASLFFLMDFALSKLRAGYEASHAVMSFIFLPLLLFFISIVGVNF